MTNTKTCYLDSNALVYLKDISAEQHGECVSVITNLITEGYNLYISPLGIDEFLYVVYFTLRKNKSKAVIKELKNALSSILSLPMLTIINPPLEKSSQVKAIEYMERFSLRPRDAYHLLIMKQHKINNFLTFDSDFDKVFNSGSVKRIK